MSISRFFVPENNLASRSSHSLFLKWLRKNFFAGPISTLVTLSISGLLIWKIPLALDWALFSAVFSGEGKSACLDGAACWIPIRNSIDFLIYGLYPVDERWRVNLSLLLGGLILPMLFSRRMPRSLLLAYVFILPVAIWLLVKGGLFLEDLPASVFGGLMLTYFLGIIAMCLSLPVAILLALGRQSKLPVIRILTVIYIEVIRSVPILTFLFMASLMAQLFLPSGMEIDKLYRVLAVMIFVSAAYKAEILRGAIQAIPQGQIEASSALGAGYWHTMIYIVLPQAMRNAVPALVSNFIGLFKETTLVSIVGLLEIIGVVRAVFQRSEWLGLDTEGYVVLSLFFFVVCFTISRYGLFLEKSFKASR